MIEGKKDMKQKGQRRKDDIHVLMTATPLFSPARASWHGAYCHGSSHHAPCFHLLLMSQS